MHVCIKINEISSAHLRVNGENENCGEFSFGGNRNFASLRRDLGPKKNVNLLNYFAVLHLFRLSAVDKSFHMKEISYHEGNKFAFTLTSINICPNRMLLIAILSAGLGNMICV